jgi:alpha/beta superfamily hydrolase
MRPDEESIYFDGHTGPIETIVENPGDPKGIALVCHPHPLFGGENTNKVVQTLARAFARMGYLALCPNFRGAGGSAGTHDNGIGETEDMLALIEAAARRYGELPVALAGYSFGAYVQTRVGRALSESGRPARRMVLVGAAVGIIEGLRRYPVEAVAKGTILIHGARDETVPLENVLAWAEPFEIPVIVVPGADHFFHRRLHILRDIVLSAWSH